MSSVNEDEWEVVDSQYYHVDHASGIIYGATGLKFEQTRKGYKVTYTAGYDFDNSATFLSDTEAGELELAFWMAAQDIWSSRSDGNNGDVVSESIGDYSVTYSKSVNQNSKVIDILSRYSRLEIVGVQSPYVY